ncbi:hypothetical protein LCGC14_0874710 [marine sediment metagenome]|uniref:PIN domain-containing protein n=1 Tax=marine sediment metagenome TaxID=412755 RepID=A0A0F9RNB5_9ZZZZ
MIKRPAEGKRLFILDTNVLMHDPTALFRFDEHDIYLPMVVLEELDRGKKGLSEVSRNVRQVSRFLDELLLEKEIDVNLVRIAPKMNRYVNEWNEKEFPDPVTVNGHEFYIVSSVSSMQKIENILLRQIFDHLPN